MFFFVWFFNWRAYRLRRVPPFGPHCYTKVDGLLCIWYGVGSVKRNLWRFFSRTDCRTWCDVSDFLEISVNLTKRNYFKKFSRKYYCKNQTFLKTFTVYTLLQIIQHNLNYKLSLQAAKVFFMRFYIKGSYVSKTISNSAEK